MRASESLRVLGLPFGADREIERPSDGGRGAWGHAAVRGGTGFGLDVRDDPGGSGEKKRLGPGGSGFTAGLGAREMLVGAERVRVWPGWQREMEGH